MTILEYIKYKGRIAEIYKGKDDSYRFRVKARNGEIVIGSEGYSTKWNAKRAARSALGVPRDAR
jgi:uncharacterized protein YegP (UPF0339 family)